MRVFFSLYAITAAVLFSTHLQGLGKNKEEWYEARSSRSRWLIYAESWGSMAGIY